MSDDVKTKEKPNRTADYVRLPLSTRDNLMLLLDEVMMLGYREVESAAETALCPLCGAQAHRERIEGCGYQKVDRPARMGTASKNEIAILAIDNLARTLRTLKTSKVAAAALSEAPRAPEGAEL